MSPPRDVWFVSLIWTEILLQLPFFFLATWAFLVGKNWIRVPAVAYGSFVCATMVPILTSLVMHEEEGYNALAVALMYVPYVVMPGILVLVMGKEQEPFSGSLLQEKKEKEKGQ